ncbi:MAG: ORF6N domain-containing protein [Bacteroidota bacterium]
MNNINLNERLLISKIFIIRGQKVMIDEDLAEMYGIETKRLNEQVKRNMLRFPEDFMFQITEFEYQNLKSQNATSSWGGRRKLPFAFTEHGVLMLSSVLNSTIAIEVNIKIMRVYTKLKEIMMNHQDITLKLVTIEKQVLKLDRRTELNEKDINDIFDALNHLITKEEEPSTPRNKIGF